MSDAATAKDLVELLRRRHSRDVFVAECKDGDSMGSHLRMDAWVMPRSWANPWTTGYEIKVSRSDFLRDDKWPGYLECCNHFYFVCPYGLIQPGEVGDGVGLIWTSKNATRLYTKVKAPRRDVEVPESLFRYVLMCRAEISERDIPLLEDEAFFRDLVQTKLDRKELGWRVQQFINRFRTEEMEKLRNDNADLRAENAALAGVKKCADDLGVDLAAPMFSRERRLRELMNGVPEDLPYIVERARKALESLDERITELKKGTA